MSVWCVVLFKPSGHVQSICLRLKCPLPQGQGNSKWSILPLACLNGETIGLFKFEWLWNGRGKYHDRVFLLFICCICDMDFHLKFWADYCILIETYHWELMKVVWSHNMMVWYFLSYNRSCMGSTVLWAISAVRIPDLQLPEKASSG